MPEQTTISVKVSREDRMRMKRLGIKPSKVLRKAIEREIKIRMAEELDRKLNSPKIKKALGKISIDDITKYIREDRDSR